MFPREISDFTYIWALHRALFEADNIREGVSLQRLN